VAIPQNTSMMIPAKVRCLDANSSHAITKPGRTIPCSAERRKQHCYLLLLIHTADQCILCWHSQQQITQVVGQPRIDFFTIKVYKPATIGLLLLMFAVVSRFQYCTFDAYRRFSIHPFPALFCFIFSAYSIPVLLTGCFKVCCVINIQFISFSKMNNNSRM